MHFFILADYLCQLFANIFNGWYIEREAFPFKPIEAAMAWRTVWGRKQRRERWRGNHVQPL
jgi:hypothetical protein